MPCIGKFEDVLLVQRTDLSVEEEILVLLHFAGELGFGRRDLGTHVRGAHQRIGEAIKRLESSECRQIVLLGSGAYRLTDLGVRRVREELADRLLVQ